MNHRHFCKWLAAWLVIWAVARMLPAEAQSVDTFGGNPGTNAFIRIPKDTDDWTRHFRLGALAGMNISASFAMKGTFGISGNDPAAGVYSAGNYVEPDQGGDPAYTANWGYTSASQYNATKGTLTMSALDSFSTDASSRGDGGPFPGLDLAYGGNLWYWKHARVGWEMGFGWLPVDISSSSTASASIIRSTYTFSTGGIIVPPAGYMGSADGYGPLIATASTESNLPASTGTITGSHKLDLSLYTLRLGPSFYWDLGQRFGLSMGAGPAVGLADGEYKYNELVTDTAISPAISTVNSGRISGAKFIYGGYVNASLMYHLVRNGDLYIGAQYMPMSNATISGGGREGTLNLNGQVYFSAGISWPF